MKKRLKFALIIISRYPNDFKEIKKSFDKLYLDIIHIDTLIDLCDIFIRTKDGFDLLKILVFINSNKNDDLLLSWDDMKANICIIFKILYNINNPFDILHKEE